MTRTSTDGRSIHMGQDEAETLARCAIAVVRTMTGDPGDGDFDAVLADLRRLPAETPGRAHLAAGLLMAMLKANDERMMNDPALIRELLAVADSAPIGGRAWPTTRAAARSMELLSRGMQGSLADPAAALSEVEHMMAGSADDPGTQPLLELSRIGLTLARATDDGDESALLRLPQMLDSISLPGGVRNAEFDRMKETFSRALHAMSAVRSDEPDSLKRALREFGEMFQFIPADHPLHAATAGQLAHMRILESTMGGDGDGPPPAVPADEVEALVAAADDVSTPASDRVMQHLTLGGALMRGGHEADPEIVERGLRHFRKALDLAGEDEQLRMICLPGLAAALCIRSDLLGSRDGLLEAKELLEAARGIMGGPHHPQWSFLHESLSQVCLRLGMLDESHQSGLEGQRGYAWRALMQSDAAGTKVAVRNAAAEAVGLARRLLASSDHIGALHALDSGRGLMLFAATEVQGIAERLRNVDQADLAERWVNESASADGVSAGLRRQVMSELRRKDAAISVLLDPPDLDEIQWALDEIEADALVYLVPGEPPQPGWALIAPAAGPPSLMPLPNLTIGDDVEVERYLTTLTERARDLDPPDYDGAFASSLDGLCDWAWRAAMGPLLEYLGCAPTPVAGRVPRLVLIAVGDLARIPWQAARHANGTYAVQVAAISHAVSARMLCENAALPPISPLPVGLIVGDPDTGTTADALAAARREAFAIRQAFYGGARYVGRRPDASVSPSGAGTTEQVRQWLTSRSPAAGTMLHLACHGSFDGTSGDARAFLLLAEAEGTAGRLSAEEIVRLMNNAAGRDVGLVVLACCHSGRSVYGYDEAYSLGTAFLAGGARSVLSTQWSIPDVATSSMMFMFHHYLRQEDRKPWEALRQAQLWMLETDRKLPEHMPADLHDPTADYSAVAAWAGFVHWGQ